MLDVLSSRRMKMKTELTLVQWKVRDITNERLFSDEAKAQTFIADLKIAYKTMKLDWDCQITAKGIVIEDR